jgi:hypothetical protein
MEKEVNVGLGKVAIACKKNKNEDPLPFLRNSSSKFQFESGIATQQERKRVIGQWTSISAREAR